MHRSKQAQMRPHLDITACRNPPNQFRIVGKELAPIEDLETGNNKSPPVGSQDFKKLLGTNMANVRTMLAYTRTALSLTGSALGMLKLGDPGREASWALVAVALLGVFMVSTHQPAPVCRIFAELTPHVVLL